MFSTRLQRPLVAALAALLVVLSYSTETAAQSADQDARMRTLQQQIDELNKQMKQIKEETSKTAKTVTEGEKKFDNFLKGFFGTMDASIDYTTKGMNGMQAYEYACTGPLGGPPCTAGATKAPPFGRVGWMAAMSSNGSNIGYRGTHKIGTSDIDFIYQVSTAFSVNSAPGLQDTWTKSSNTVQGAIGLGDTYLGLRNHLWGTIRFGELFMPYKTATDRLNPFSGQLGDYSVVMGNTGGDNRVEFGTRMDHVIEYLSPNWNGFSFDLAYALGQNPDPSNNITPLGSPDCTGANNPGSGNLFLNCDDGGFNNAYSADLKFETGGLYLTAAYELHQNVNRSSDGVGSNNPIYGFYNSAAPCVGAPPGSAPNPAGSPLLDLADYCGYLNEYPNAAIFGSPEYSTAYDLANEYAYKFGGQYHFDFGLTVSVLYESMHRDLPAIMEFQNERERTGDWVSFDYVFPNGADRIAAGWAHATATPGDPGGQHNFNPNGIGNNQANMYTVAWWHKLDKQLTWYADIADTSNDGNAHFDIGAGGHGVKTDCHDATHPLFIDYSSAGPTTWGGCHELGISTGLNFRF
jgi:predicted porin